MGVVLAQVGGDRGLCQQGIGGDGLAGEVAELVEQRDRDPDLVGALGLAVVTGQHGFFLAPGDGRVMAAGPEDMDLTARLVDRSLHGLAVDGQRRVVVTVGREPSPQRGIESGATFTIALRRQ